MGRYKGLPVEPIKPYLKHYSQHELARAIGVHQSAVSYWSRGLRNISIGNADKLACFFGLHPLCIWGREDYESAR